MMGCGARVGEDGERDGGFRDIAWRVSLIFQGWDAIRYQEKFIFLTILDEPLYIGDVDMQVVLSSVFFPVVM